MVASSSSLPPPPGRWPPGFRFRPTDQELVGFYLMRKVAGRHMQPGIIAEVDLYKCEPWDLPDKSSLGNDVEWYFFSPRDKKYPNGSRTNRATEAGYWKATGKDRVVRAGSRGIGMKKTLVFYKGRAPHGQRTDWIMHEYRLDEGDGQHFQDTFVLCRVFRKSTPKNEEEAIPSYLDEDLAYSAIVVPEEEKEATETDGGQIFSPEAILPVPAEEAPTSQAAGDDALDAILMMLLEEPTEESQMLPFAEEKAGAGFFDTDSDLLEQIQHCIEPQNDGAMIQAPGAGDITDVLSGDFIELDDLTNAAPSQGSVANTANGLVVPSENKFNWMDALVQDGHSVYIMENGMTSASAAEELPEPVLEEEGGGGPVKRFLSMLGGSVHVLPASAAEYPARQKLLNVHVTVTYERPLVKKRDKQQQFSSNLLFVFLVGSLSALFWILLWPGMSKLASYMHAVVLL